MNIDDELHPIDQNWVHPHSAELQEVEEQIRLHPGGRLSIRLQELQRVLGAWAGFSAGLSDLLDACENQESYAIELMRNVGDQSGRLIIIRSLDQAIIAYVAGLGAVIDHTRSVVQKQSEAIKSEYAERTTKLVENHPAAPFLGKLRNYVLHNVAAPWEFSGTFSDRVQTRVALNSAVLLEDKKWTGDAKEFIIAAGQSIHLSPLLPSYLEAMIGHIEQAISAVLEDNVDSIDECNDLIRKRNMLLTAGATDGHDWEDRMAHVADNLRRASQGEPQIDFRTGRPVTEDTHPDPSH